MLAIATRRGSPGLVEEEEDVPVVVVEDEEVEVADVEDLRF